MTPAQMIRLSRLTRPVFRRRTPFLFPVLRQFVRLACPPSEPGRGCEFTAPFEGGLIHIDTGSSIEYHLLFRGCHEPAIVDLIRRHVKPGHTCLDVGANVGALALVMAQATGAAGRVIAVEPHPGICERLRRNVALNALGHVRVVEAVIADRDGEADFYGFDERAFHKGISSLLPDAEACRKMTVRSLRGESLLAAEGVDRCDFLKIDVEGFESVVLREFKGLIDRARPVLIMEYRQAHWAKFGHSLPETAAWLAGLGYRLTVIRRARVRPLTFPVPESCELLAVPGHGV